MELTTKQKFPTGFNLLTLMYKHLSLETGENKTVSLSEDHYKPVASF